MSVPTRQVLCGIDGRSESAPTIQYLFIIVERKQIPRLAETERACEWERVRGQADVSLRPYITAPNLIKASESRVPYRRSGAKPSGVLCAMPA